MISKTYGLGLRTVTGACGMETSCCEVGRVWNGSVFRYVVSLCDR